MTAGGRHRKSLAFWVGCALAVAVFTVVVQVEYWDLDHLREEQLRRHQEALAGESQSAFAHWKFRVLMLYVVELGLAVTSRLRVPDPVLTAFIGIRLLQNFAVFLLAMRWYRRLGLDRREVLLGVWMLALGMTNALYDSDLSFNTYMDLVLYLATVLLLEGRRYLWIVPLTVLAALNSERAGMIPLLLAAEALPWRRPFVLNRRVLILSGVALGAYGATFLGLRLWLGHSSGTVTFGMSPGLGQAVFNISRPQTWVNLVATLGAIPLVALLAPGRWPPLLRRITVVLVPAWVAIHFASSLVAETRLMLTPFALAIVPAALFALRRAPGKGAAPPVEVGT